MSTRAVLISLAAAAASLHLPAQAATEVEMAKGTITVGNPLGRSIGSIAEIWNDCGSDRRLDGVDGITFEVPAAARGKQAILSTAPAAGNDADVYWFDASCRPTQGHLNAEGTGNETGTVPSNASSGVINLVQGRDASVRLVYILPNT